MKFNLMCALAALMMHVCSFGQNPVPNAGFEHWTDTEPNAWFTSNAPGFDHINITKTSPGHTGAYALKGTVESWPGAPGVPFIPLLESNTSDFGFPVEAQYPFCSLYYKFHPADPSDVLSIFISILDDQGSAIGGGFAEISAASDSFALLNIPLVYFSGQPYRGIISMTINNNGPGSLPAIGSYFIVDDIAMGAMLSAANEAGPQTLVLEGIYPNPAAEACLVQFNLLEPTALTISLFDLNGKAVSTLFSGYLNAGVHNIPASVNQLPAGPYFCRLTTEQGVVVRKLIKT